MHFFLVNSNLFACTICYITYNSRNQHEKHILGKEHLRKINLIKQIDAQISFYNFCVFCYKTFSSDKQFSYHIGSLSHEINKKKYFLYQCSAPLEKYDKEFIDETDKCIIYNSGNYIESCKILHLENGGQFFIDKKNFFSLNTCSIDYFLMIIFIIQTNHTEKTKLLKDDIRNLFETIYALLSCNEWQKARITWLEYCPSLERSIKKKNVYNWFLSEYEAYFFNYRNNQFYSWITKCNNNSDPLCVNSVEKKKNFVCIYYKVHYLFRIQIKNIN